MPAQEIDNGRVTPNYDLEVIQGPSGLIQVIAERELVPIDVPTAGNRRFTVGANGGTPYTLATLGLPATANRAQLSLEGGASAPGCIRWLDEATADPASNHGHLLTAASKDSTYLWIHGRTRLLNFALIRADVSTIDPVVQMSYYE